jgi:hypothetical protein
MRSHTHADSQFDVTVEVDIKLPKPYRKDMPKTLNLVADVFSRWSRFVGAACTSRFESPQDEGCRSGSEYLEGLPSAAVHPSNWATLSVDKENEVCGTYRQVDATSLVNRFLPLPGLDK